MITVPMKVAVSQVEVPMSVQTDRVVLPMTISAEYVATAYDTYEGEYEFTPSAETQTISTAEKVLFQDIVIQPIPENYGLITWNGSVITVS